MKILYFKPNQWNSEYHILSQSELTVDLTRKSPRGELRAAKRYFKLHGHTAFSVASSASRGEYWLLESGHCVSDLSLQRHIVSSKLKP